MKLSSTRYYQQNSTIKGSYTLSKWGGVKIVLYVQTNQSETQHLQSEE